MGEHLPGDESRCRLQRRPAERGGRVTGILFLALGAMLVQQTVTTWGKGIIPVVGPAMTRDLGLDPALIGIFVAIAGVASTAGATICGRWIQRFGAMRVSQGSLLLMASGLALASTGWLPAVATGAFVLGIGTVMATPASSEILARYAPPRQAPLIFSIKQTGVPAGTMMAGLVGPLLVALIDWRAAVLVTAGIGLLLAGVLEPLTKRFDAGAERSIRRVGVFATMLAIMRDPAMRGMALAQGAYVGLQNTFTTFFVTFMVVKLHYDLVTAGQVFAAANLAAVFSRVFWGWLSIRVGGPRRLLALLGLAMAAVSGILGLVTPEWPLAAVVAVALALAGTAVSWHGVNLSEIARMSPPGMVGAMTGGIIAFGSSTAIVYPLAMSVILATTESYALCFWIAALPPLLVGLSLLRTPPMS